MLSEELKDKLLNYKSRREYNIIDAIPVLGYIIPKVEQLEKEIEKLENQIENMKNCGNCKHSSCICDDECYQLRKWELKH